jgi:leucine dehydrogenase
MSVFAAKDFAGHEQVVFCSDRASGLKAIIAVHDTHLGPALGGCRMWDYAREEDAITDALRLSRGMTYKAAISGLALGGGKSVILGDPRRDKSEALLEAMGRFVESLGGRYITAEDVGTTVADIDVMRRRTRHARGSSADSGDPSPATAYGVYMGIRAAVDFRLKRNSLAGLKVAVQGVGSVGMHLCSHLAEEGAELYVADVSRGAVDEAVARFGATAVATTGVHALDADVFAPCALGAAINDSTLAELRAGIVAGSANNQLAEPRHGELLHRRGVLYAPDYVINAGGLIQVAQEGAEAPEKLFAKVARIYDTLTEIFRRAAAEGRPTHEVADRIAEARFRRH